MEILVAVCLIIFGVVASVVFGVVVGVVSGVVASVVYYEEMMTKLDTNSDMEEYLDVI